MKEKQPAKLSESCRLMQDSSKVELFRSGAANDEFDGLARYSEIKMAVGNLGGNAGKFSSHWGWRAYFFICCKIVLANWVVPREKRLAPMGKPLIFIEGD